MVVWYKVLVVKYPIPRGRVESMAIPSMLWLPIIMLGICRHLRLSFVFTSSRYRLTPMGWILCGNVLIIVPCKTVRGTTTTSTSTCIYASDTTWSCNCIVISIISIIIRNMLITLSFNSRWRCMLLGGGVAWGWGWTSSIPWSAGSSTLGLGFKKKVYISW